MTELPDGASENAAEGSNRQQIAFNFISAPAVELPDCPCHVCNYSAMGKGRVLYHAMIAVLGESLPQDYASAAVRHLEDATTLYEAGRHDNAGHLIGFAAECAIKHRIRSISPGKSSPQGHFPEILIAARKHLGQRTGHTGMYNIIKNEIFKGWSVNRRYDQTGHTRPEDVAQWFATTKRLFAAAQLRAHR